VIILAASLLFAHICDNLYLLFLNVIFPAISITLKKALKETEFDELSKNLPDIKAKLKLYFDLYNSYTVTESNPCTTLIPFSDQVTLCLS
jgi:hypothetical protein